MTEWVITVNIDDQVEDLEEVEAALNAALVIWSKKEVKS